MGYGERTGPHPDQSGRQVSCKSIILATGSERYCRPSRLQGSGGRFRYYQQEALDMVELPGNIGIIGGGVIGVELAMAVRLWERSPCL